MNQAGPTPSATLAVVPARGGSRRLPGKNLRLLEGAPLIVHTIRAALSAERVDRVIVSTDADAIARVALAAGAEVPFSRPAELATDAAATLPVIRHAVEWFEANHGRVGVVVTLQPTSPLRDASEIDAAVGLLDDPAVDSAVSVAPIGLPGSVVGVVARGRYLAALPEDARPSAGEAAPPAVRLTGAVYVTRRELLAQDRLLGDRPAALVTDPARAIDIDTPSDLRRARRLARRPS